MKAITISKSRQVAAALIAGTLAFATMAPSSAFALTADEASGQEITYNPATNNSGDTAYWLQLSDADIAAMSVDVPVKVTLAVKADGTFITPSATKNVIENDSEFPVNVTEMSIAKATDTDFAITSAKDFATSSDNNIIKGSIASVDHSNVETDLQRIAFTELADSFSANTAWAMAASDAAEKTGNDCLFIQVGGAIANVSGHYFNNAIEVFDITYTFEATTAPLNDPVEESKSITD